MGTQKMEVLNNFDETNIASVEKAIKNPTKKVFTMLQENNECKVEVTEGSRDKCADIICS